MWGWVDNLCRCAAKQSCPVYSPKTVITHFLGKSRFCFLSFNSQWILLLFLLYSSAIVSWTFLWDQSMLFFWVVTPCGLVGRYQHFGETYHLHFQDWSVSPEDGGSTFLQYVGSYLWFHMVSQPRTTTLTSSLQWEPQTSLYEIRFNDWEETSIF
jgi:hypothetical protein